MEKNLEYFKQKTEEMVKNEDLIYQIFGTIDDYEYERDHGNQSVEIKIQGNTLNASYNLGENHFYNFLIDIEGDDFIYVEQNPFCCTTLHNVITSTVKNGKTIVKNTKLSGCFLEHDNFMTIEGSYKDVKDLKRRHPFSRYQNLLRGKIEQVNIYDEQGKEYYYSYNESQVEVIRNEKTGELQLRKYEDGSNFNNKIWFFRENGHLIRFEKEEDFDFATTTEDCVMVRDPNPNSKHMFLEDDRTTKNWEKGTSCNPDVFYAYKQKKASIQDLKRSQPKKMVKKLD